MFMCIFFSNFTTILPESGVDAELWLSCSVVGEGGLAMWKAGEKEGRPCGKQVKRGSDSQTAGQ